VSIILLFFIIISLARWCDFDQVADLIAAMMSIHDSSSHMPHKLVLDCQSAQKPRFRPTVIAIIAANRLLAWSAVSHRIFPISCRVFPACDRHWLQPMCSNVVYIGDFKCHDDDGNSQPLAWFTNPLLESVISAALSDLNLAIDGRMFYFLLQNFIIS